MEPRLPVKVHVLERVEHIEPQEPEQDRGPEHERGASSVPVTAIHAPIGASEMAMPRNACDRKVNRLV